MALRVLPNFGVLAEQLAQLQKTFPLITSVRYWRERPDYVNRYGYDKEWYIKGPFPRQKPTPELMPLPTKPVVLKNRWNYKRALFGQNDYIDILGDGTVHPRDLLQGPAWLKGWKGMELQRLIRKRGATMFYMPDARPTAWNNMQKRIRFLWKFYNLRQNHKDRMGPPTRCE